MFSLLTCRVPDGLLPAGVRWEEGARPAAGVRAAAQDGAGQEPGEAGHTAARQGGCS